METLEFTLRFTEAASGLVTAVYSEAGIWALCNDAGVFCLFEGHLSGTLTGSVKNAKGH